MRAGLTVDQMAEARRLKKFQLVDEDTRRGSGIDPQAELIGLAWIGD